MEHCNTRPVVQTFQENRLKGERLGKKLGLSVFLRAIVGMGLMLTAPILESRAFFIIVPYILYLMYFIYSRFMDIRELSQCPNCRLPQAATTGPITTLLWDTEKCVHCGIQLK